MKHVSSTEIKNRFGQYLESAIAEPVVIEKAGREVAVLLSFAEYDRLQRLEDFGSSIGLMRGPCIASKSAEGTMTMCTSCSNAEGVSGLKCSEWKPKRRRARRQRVLLAIA